MEYLREGKILTFQSKGLVELNYSPKDKMATASYILGFLGRVVSLIEDFLMAIAALALACTMLIIVSDVALRYGFNSPLRWSYELIGKYLMVGAFFCAVPQTLRKREHINIDLFVLMMPPKFRHIASVVICLAALPFFAAMFSEGLKITIEAFVKQEVQLGAIAWPTWMSNIFVPIGIGVLLLRLGLNLIGHAAIVAGVSASSLDDSLAVNHISEDVEI